MDFTATHDRPQLGPEDRARIMQILWQHGVTRASLFGSFARGEQRQDSDIDLLIEAPLRATLLDLGQLEVELEDAYVRHVDLVTFRELLPALRDRILSEQVKRY